MVAKCYSSGCYRDAVNFFVESYLDHNQDPIAICNVCVFIFLDAAKKLTISASYQFKEISEKEYFKYQDLQLFK